MSTSLQRVVVTGVTGLLGSNVVGELVDSGVEVTGVVRDLGQARERLGSVPGLELVPGDVLNASPLIPTLAGADAIIHTAAYFREYYSSRYDADLLDRTNVAAVEDLVLAAQAAKVPVVVHISSAGTLGPTPPGVLADEDTQPGTSSSRNRYFASKVRSERLVAQLRERTGVRIPVIVPGWMWGPGDFAPTASGQMFAAVADGALTGVPRVGAHIVDARDVAQACIRAAVARHNRRWVVAGDRHDLPAVCAHIADLHGVPAPNAISPRLAIAGSRVLMTVDRLRGRAPVATPRGTRALLEMDRQRISSARAQSELKISFRSIAETLGDEAAWYRQRRIRLGTHRRGGS